MSRFVRIAACLLLVSSAANGQQPVSVGSRIRAFPRTGEPLVGTVAALDGDTLVLQTSGRRATLHVDSLIDLEISAGRGLQIRKAGRGAATGFAALVVPAYLGLYRSDSGDRSSRIRDALLGGAVGAVGGAALSGGGRSARVGAWAVGIAGGIAGVVYGLAVYEPCRPDAWLCMDFGPEAEALGYGLVGAVAGGWVGAVIGALIPVEEWESSSLQRLRMSVTRDRRGRSRIGVSLSF